MVPARPFYPPQFYNFPIIRARPSPSLCTRFPIDTSCYRLQLSLESFRFPSHIAPALMPLAHPDRPKGDVPPAALHFMWTVADKDEKLENTQLKSDAMVLLFLLCNVENGVGMIDCNKH